LEAESEPQVAALVDDLERVGHGIPLLPSGFVSMTDA
jgi:hypothetical protein